MHNYVIDQDFEDRILNKYKFAAVRALLQLADTRASRKEGEGDKAEYSFKEFDLDRKRYPNLRPVQSAAQALGSESISILRAPTGSGKTYASLLWADRQINEFDKADRLVIAMPTRFTSNALSISVAEQIDEVGLYHSSAWHNRFGDITESEAKNIAAEEHRMARYLATPVTVSTVDHLLICLTGTKEQHHSTFFFLANSTVVFDEADFYDPFVQANIKVLLDVLKVLEVPVLIMSATVPDSIRELYGIDASITIPEKEDEKEKNKFLQLIDNDQLNEASILAKMVDDGYGIIYANTIAKALSFYERLKYKCAENGVPLVIYHSRFTEPDKKIIEDKLIAMLGKKAWKYHAVKPVKGIAVMTQIGEMSVNISSPIMLSEVTPWDRLAQRIGRLVRFEKQNNGICYLTIPMKEGKIYPAPYGIFDRENYKWIATKPFKQTLQNLRDNFSVKSRITEDKLEDLVNQLYPSAPEIIGNAQTNQINYKSLIKYNWLILPDRYSDEEGGYIGGTDDWSSRHIPAQQVVITEFVPAFTDYNDYYAHLLKYGVSVPVYQIEKECKKENDSRIGKSVIPITKNDDSIDVYYTTDYSSDMGLAFLYDY